MSLPALRLKRNEDKRLRNGHLWVFSNEVDTRLTPLKGLPPGTLARVQDAAGKDVGLAFVSPQSLICARLVSRDAHAPIDRDFFQARLARALALRERHFPVPFYRWVYGEGDLLPGLVVDRYGDYLVVQTATWGMENALPLILDALSALVQPRGILLKNNGSARKLEGLPAVLETARGSIPERLAVEENGCRFQVDVLGGQKTGWFYDHRANRARLRDWVAGRRVLDLFSYVGGWGVQAAAFGAREVLCVDSSAPALALVHENARLNQVEARVHTHAGDVFAVLKELAEAPPFDVVILDPPAFIKSRKDLAEGVQAYRRVNQLALKVLAADGLLVSASCSHHLSRDLLLEQVARAAAQQRAPLQLLAEGHQDLDHPIHPGIPESAYIKALFLHRTQE